MTLGDFFEILANNPSVVIFYFFALPLTAFLASVFGKGEGEISPWKYLYSTLVYLACIPGIFAITLSVYLFMFERQSIMDTNMYTQILPIICMFLTLWLIKRNIAFDAIPGFGKITGLVIIITAIIVLMWIVEKTHIIAITFIPFPLFILLFIVLLVVIRYGWKKSMGAK